MFPLHLKIIELPPSYTPCEREGGGGDAELGGKERERQEETGGGERRQTTAKTVHWTPVPVFGMLS